MTFDDEEMLVYGVYLKQDIGGEIKRQHARLVQEVMAATKGGGGNYPEDRIRQTYGLTQTKEEGKDKEEDDPMTGAKPRGEEKTPGQVEHGGSAASTQRTGVKPPLPPGAPPIEKVPDDLR